MTIDYEYDSLYRLTETNYSTGDYYHYTYDAVGNRLSQTTELAVTSYQYDVANRLTSVDGVNYTWDNNGNLLNDGANTYTYDSANRLTSSNGTSSYAYNGLGDRLTQNGVNYTLDLNSGLTQVLNDGTNQYLYGLGRIAQAAGTTTEYFLPDALGSVRQMTDASGQVTLANTYEPYGNLAQTAGSAQTSYGFTGEWTDPSGMVYLRARYYNPSDGRFLTRDPFAGYLNLPQSQNPYTYAINNPIRYTDPSGNCFTGMVVDTMLCVAGAMAIIDLAIQLHRNNGNFDCVDWGEVVVAGGAGAVATLVGIVAWGAIVPYTGSTLVGYMGAGGLSGIVAGQAARATALALSGHGDQIISSFAQPGDVLSDFGFGTMGGAIGYGVESIAFGLRISVGVPDEFLPPSATGQWRNWSIPENVYNILPESGLPINPRLLVRASPNVIEDFLPPDTPMDFSEGIGFENDPRWTIYNQYGNMYQIRYHVATNPQFPNSPSGQGTTIRFGTQVIPDSEGLPISEVELNLADWYLRQQSGTSSGVNWSFGRFYIDRFGFAYFDSTGKLVPLISDAGHIPGYGNPWTPR